MDMGEIRDGLKEALQETARWRRLKAQEHPDDQRNLEAAAMLDKLAATVNAVSDHFLDAYGALYDDFRDSEQHSEMMREIGFHSWPETAEDFVKDYIADKTGGAS